MRIASRLPVATISFYFFLGLLSCAVSIFSPCIPYVRMECVIFTSILKLMVQVKLLGNFGV